MDQTIANELGGTVIKSDIGNLVMQKFLMLISLSYSIT